MLFVRSVLTLILFLCVSPAVWCQTLYVTLSDSHSNYDNLVKFLQVLEVKVENFKTEHPKGNVVLLINGDYSGASGLASVNTNGKFDAGTIGLEALKSLAQNDIYIIFNSGNHEAHDFAKKDKNNQRYVEQMKDLKTSGEKMILIGTNQNFLASTGLDQTFVKRYDYKDPTLGTNRILGLTLQNLETKSSIESSDKLFSSIEDYETNLSREIEKAIKEQVPQVTIMIHDETPMVLDVAHKIEAKYQNQIHFNIWMAGHDHKEAKILTDLGTPILNAGSQFGFMDWKDTGKPITLNDIKLFDMEKYSNWKSRGASSYNTPLARAIQKVRTEAGSRIETLKAGLLGTNHGTYNIKEGKLQMKKSRERTELGVALANSMRSWAKNEVSSSLPVAGLFNTSSYRVDQKFGQIDLTDLHIVEMYPFIVHGKIHKLRGEELLEILQKTTLFQENISAVQLSENLRLITEHKEIISHKNSLPKTIEYPIDIEIFTNNQWRKLKGAESIIVGMDDWTAINGYQNKYTSKYLKEHLKSDAKDILENKKMDVMLEVLQTHLPRELKQAAHYKYDQLHPVQVPIKINQCSKLFP